MLMIDTESDHLFGSDFLVNNDSLRNTHKPFVRPQFALNSTPSIKLTMFKYFLALIVSIYRVQESTEIFQLFSPRN